MNNAARFTAAVLAVLLASCATPPEQRLKERGRAAGVHTGMHKRHVIKRMGEELVTVRDTRGEIRAIVPNPYSSESFRSGGADYEVLYYFTNPAPKDGPVTHDELTPFVFRGGRVAGKGWAFYESLPRDGQPGAGPTAPPAPAAGGTSRTPAASTEKPGV